MKREGLRSGIGDALPRPASGAARRALSSLLCAALLLPAAAWAQPVPGGVAAGAAVWRWQNPTPTGNLLLGARFLDGDHAWAIGAEGTCLRTTDGGATWASAGPQTNRWLHGISFFDLQHGWVVGHDGAIFATTDGGASWTAQDAGADAPYLKGVDFVSATTGWAVGKWGVVMRTTDGGAHWVRQSIGTATNLEGVDFVSSTTGWAVGEGGEIYRTTDGGAHWFAQTSPLAGDFEDVSFADATHGCAAGLPGIVCTVDGGANWFVSYEKSPGYTRFDYMHGLHLLANGTGWAVAESGETWVTANGGVDWTPAGIAGGGLYAVHALTTSLVLGVGEEGVIFLSGDGGATWSPRWRNAGYGTNLSAADFLDDGLTGWAVGYGGHILHTVDGGENWSPQDTVIPAGYLSAVDATSATRAWAVGDGGVILTTTNGGSIWDQSTYSTTEWHALNDVDFLEDGSTTGWAVGDDGTIVRTDNGTAWTRLESAATGHLKGVSFVDALYGWAVGESGIFHTTTGGLDPQPADPLVTGWVAQPAPGGGALNAVHFVDRLRGWAVGNAGLILHTADGGTTWTQQQWLNPGYLYPDFKDVWFADELHGWVVGVPFGSLMLRTVDGGATWDLQSSGCSQTLEGVVFSGPNRGWAVGLNDAILRFDGPVETVAPATATSAVPAWTNRAVTVRLTPSDAGSGAAWTWRQIDGGAWQAARSASFAIDPDYHATDGVHRLAYFSTDNAGNRETQKTLSFGIDTQRPWTRVLLPVSVTRGATATIRYRVNDPLPNGRTATATVQVRNAAGLLVKKIIAKGVRVNANLAASFVCTLLRGVYTVRVAATDAARNTQYDQQGQTLTVR